MADEVKTEEQLLKEEEAELTSIMLSGMPSKTEIRTAKNPGKLAQWEKQHSQYKARWRYVRGRVGKSTSIESIRPE